MIMQKSEQNDEIEINVAQLLSIVLSKWAVIILMAIICATASFLVSKYLINPTYTSTTRIYITNKQDGGSSTSYSDLQSASQLTQDYMELVKSRTVLEKVISETGINSSASALAGKISVSNKTNTRILEISVEYDNPASAQKIANTLAKVSSDSICSIMSIEKVNIVDTADYPCIPSKPNITKNTAIAAAVGVIVTIIIVVVRYLMNDTISNSEDIEKYLGISTLALIPLSDEMDDGSDKKKKRHKSSGKSGDKRHGTDKKENVGEGV